MKILYNNEIVEISDDFRIINGESLSIFKPSLCTVLKIIRDGEVISE